MSEGRGRCAAELPAPSAWEGPDPARRCWWAPRGAPGSSQVEHSPVLGLLSWDWFIWSWMEHLFHPVSLPPIRGGPKSQQTQGQGPVCCGSVAGHKGTDLAEH